MNNLIKDIFISILSSGVFVTFFAFVLRKTIEQWIDNIFIRRLEEYKHENQKHLEELKHKNDVKLTQIGTQLDYLEHKAIIADKQRFSGFKEFASLIYRSKNQMQQIVNNLNKMQNVTEEDRNKRIAEIIDDVFHLYENYSEHLYGLILFIEKPLFDKLHIYKKNIFDLRQCLMLLNEDGNHFDDYQKKINNLVSISIKSYAELIELLQKSLGLDHVINLPDH